ncbi:alpha-N-acetylgalactosamine-specific lectin-like [Argopecten irradians]|uniref:alpha-N-acetylgalactosamine-specific lectin-like n=1 Tax=Argopecten irradians TaxID=31199 RepID=UPI00371984C8
MWVPRLLLGLLIVCYFGKVKGQIPTTPLVARRPVTGIPNIKQYLPYPASITKLLLAGAVGFITNKVVLKPGDPIEKCPEGWFKRNGRCYFFSDKKATWYGSETLCRIRGGYLAIPDTAAENAILKTLAESEKQRLQGGLPHVPHFARWMGLRSLDGTTIQKIINNEAPTFTDYAANQPSDLNDYPCLKFDDIGKFQWKNDKCHRAFFYICERNLHEPFEYTP